MNERERTHSEAPQPTSAGSAGSEGAGLNALHATGAALLAAADDAIARVLSGDSQAFNEAVRQGGGE